VLEFFKTFSEPNEFSLFPRNAVDEEEDGIMIEDEDDFDIGVDELLPDSDVRDSLVYALVSSTPQGVGETDPEELCASR
jgi:hypothetical protein